MSESEKKFSNVKYYFLLLVLIAVAIVAVVQKDELKNLIAQDDQQEVVVVTPQALDVSCLGQAVPGDRVIHISAPVGVIIDEIMVQRGDYVKAGTVLAKLRGVDVNEASVEYAKLAIDAAQVELLMIQKGRRKEDIEAEEAYVAWLEEEADILGKHKERNEILYKKQSVSKEKHEESKSVYEKAKLQLLRGQAILKGYRSGREEEVQHAEIKLKLAKVKLKEAKAKLELNYIKAPKDGQILDILAYPGEGAKGIDLETVFYMGDTQNMMILAEVYETDISRVKVGAKSLFTSKALGWELEGEVVEIQNYLDSGRIYDLDPLIYQDRRIVVVYIKPDQPEILQKYSNAQVSVKILTQ